MIGSLKYLLLFLGLLAFPAQAQIPGSSIDLNKTAVTGGGVTNNCLIITPVAGVQRVGQGSCGSGSGTVTTVSVATANGFAGSVANPTTTPAITISTTVTGLLKGNGTAVSAATNGTDYLSPGTTATLTVGYSNSTSSGSGALGTPTNGSTVTLSCANGQFQNLTNNVAGFTIAPPATDCPIQLTITNGASAGTITWSSITGSKNGDAFTTTNTSVFVVSYVRANSVNRYYTWAQQ